VIFAIQRAEKFVQCEMQLPEPMALIDAITEERFEGQHSVRVPMSGCSCRMLLCERSNATGTRRKAPSARWSETPC
jgi:hypothetical protein